MRTRRFIRFGLKRLAGAEVHGIGLNLTRRCNLDCEYCRIVDNSRERFEKELSVDQWKQIIDRFVRFGHTHFVFTGGEPFVYRGLYELIDYASTKAMTSVITNTTFLNPERFEKIRNLDFLTFSFDTVHDDSEVFTKNPTERLGLISEYCKRYDITPSAILTVTSKNHDQVPRMIELLDAHGVSSMLSIIHSAEEDFDFRNYTPDLEFQTEQDRANLGRLQERLLTMKRAGYSIAETEEFIGDMHRWVDGTWQIDCPAADPFFTVDYDGRIKACHDTPASRVSALDFEDYEAMRREVKKSIKPNCNCYYNCYVYGRNSMVQDLQRALAR